MKRRIVLLVFAFAVLLLVGRSSDTSVPSWTYRDEIMNDLGIADPVDPVQVAIAARNFVSTHVIDATAEPSIPRSRDGRYAMYQQLKKNNVRLQCSGMSALLQFMLNEVGVPSHMVILASEDAIAFGLNHPQSSHVVLEAGVDKPFVVDTYFNAAFKCGGVGDLLSADEMVDCRYGVTWEQGPLPNTTGRASMASTNYHHYLYRAIPVAN
jgi:hypothetical protein